MNFLLVIIMPYKTRNSVSSFGTLIIVLLIHREHKKVDLIEDKG